MRCGLDLRSGERAFERRKAALRKAQQSSDSDVAGMALMALAVAMRDRGDDTGARSAFRRVVNSRHPDLAPIAMVLLADQLRAAGKIRDAGATYQNAIDTGHPLAAPRAIHLGELLDDAGDESDARLCSSVRLSWTSPSRLPFR